VIVAFATLLLAPSAAAEPDVVGTITADEQQEINQNGHRNCVTLDQIAEASSPLTSIGVKSVIDGYTARGWDLESGVDIVWESITGYCPEYLPQVKIAARSYGDAS
jgi:hypothetical protein